MAKRALITGITGQDGSYLAEFLLDQGYEVCGMVRRSSTLNFERIAHIQDRITLVAGPPRRGVDDQHPPDNHPTEVYNLAAQSFVQTSWNQPVLTGETTALGVTRVLDAIRIVDRGSASTRPARRRCSARSSRCPEGVHALLPRSPTASPRSTGTGSPSTTGRATTSTPRRASSSTTNHPGGGWSSSPQGHPRRGPDQAGLDEKLALGNLDASGTGGSPPTTCGPCG